MRAVLSGMVLLAIASLSVINGQPASSAAAMCSCPDCTNPVDAANSIITGRAVSFRFAAAPTKCFMVTE